MTLGITEIIEDIFTFIFFHSDSNFNVTQPLLTIEENDFQKFEQSPFFKHQIGHFCENGSLKTERDKGSC